MRVDDAELHAEFERSADEQVHVGDLPPWTHVEGRVAWYVAMGPYSKLGDLWQEFMGKVHGGKLPVTGPPGDVYICDPADHEADGHRKLMTLLWAPMKD